MLLFGDVGLTFTAVNVNLTSPNNNIQHQHQYTLPLDKDLLAAARMQFSGPPIEGISTNFIPFQQGEIMNPFRGGKQITLKICDNNNIAASQAANPDSQFELDPMRPLVVRLTEQSAEGDQRFFESKTTRPENYSCGSPILGVHQGSTTKRMRRRNDPD